MRSHHKCWLDSKESGCFRLSCFHMSTSATTTATSTDRQTDRAFNVEFPPFGEDIHERGHTKEGKHNMMKVKHFLDQKRSFLCFEIFLHISILLHIRTFLYACAFFLSSLISVKSLCIFLYSRVNVYFYALIYVYLSMLSYLCIRLCYHICVNLYFQQWVGVLKHWYLGSVHLLCYMGNSMLSTIRPNWFKVIASDCTIALLGNCTIVWFPVCHAKERADLINNTDISELYRLSTRCHCRHIKLTF